MRVTNILFAIPLLLTMTVSNGDEAGGKAAGKVLRLSEPVEVTETYEVFGSPMDATGSAVGLEELVTKSDEYLDKTVLVTTRIAKVCQKKGCFFIAQEGDAVARVTFKDYGFFIPTDSGGKTVTLAGTFTRGELSPEKARHYRKDLGEAPAGAAKATMEYQIVATSVRIPKS